VGERTAGKLHPAGRPGLIIAQTSGKAIIQYQAIASPTIKQSFLPSVNGITLGRCPLMVPTRR
jgi:hypothetical protein